MVTWLSSGSFSTTKLHRCRGPRRDHLCQFLWLSLMGFGRGGKGVKFWAFASSPLQHWRIVVVEGGNVLHHVKRRGIVRKGEMFGGICPGKCPDPLRICEWSWWIRVCGRDNAEPEIQSVSAMSHHLTRRRRHSRTHFNKAVLSDASRTRKLNHPTNSDLQNADHVTCDALPTTTRQPSETRRDFMVVCHETIIMTAN